MTARKPVLTLKLATSLDGRIALANGASQWITGAEARAEVHRLRAASDAVLTGIGTVLADDPLMTARPDGELAERQPFRAVLDTRLRFPETAQMLADTSGPVLIYCGRDVPGHAVSRLQEKGAEIVPVSRFDGPSIAFRSVIEDLVQRECNSILIEAGSRVAGAALRSGLVDRIEWFRAPVMLGGDSRPVLDALGFERLDEAPIFTREQVTECGPDLHETYVRAKG
ncbi:RibD family protein [Hyphobacterium marinum]|uniref:RibD family protein n=1 Tax=Hyphobacterium marinum TaxID=3116574 RepID=A0ABU7LYS0_9PROT|nr:RibD family protein [Hyphobacterium sp. Y6023]MEE2566675.1 RibD family protein [Hyphobacterium sp. Y6023]